MVAAKASALAEYQRSLNAKENLIDSAEESPEKQAIGEELTTLSRTIDRCKSSLTQYAAGPVASAQAIRATLQDPAKLAPNQRADLESQLRAAESAITAATKELPDLEKQREALHAKLRTLEQEKLKPENFKVVRRQRQPAEAV